MSYIVDVITAAPALAASIAAVAICSGLRGTLSLRSCVLPEPVNAAVMKTLSRMASGMVRPLMCRYGYGLWETEDALRRLSRSAGPIDRPRG